MPSLKLARLPRSNLGPAAIDPASATIKPAPLTAALTAGTTGLSKTYDGNTLATLTSSNFALSGFLGADSASVIKTVGNYANKNVGNNMLISTTLAPTDFSALGSTLLSNYSLPTGASGNIGTIKPARLDDPGRVHRAQDGSAGVRRRRRPSTS